VVKTVVLYEYDPQLRPGELGADFEDGNPNHSYTLRYEGIGATLLRDVSEWLGIKRSQVLYDKLKELMPKKPESKDGTMLRFDPQPIRKSAEAFAHAIDYELPTDQQELRDLLWVFGECLEGHMERQMAITNKLVEDVMATQSRPVIFYQESS